MAVVPDETIAVAALTAGFSRSDAATAVAVALAESGGDATATNHNSDGSTDYGLWQINSSHPQLLASGSWQIPNDNAHMAYALWHGRGNVWRDWMAYNAGKHIVFMGRATKAVNAVSDNGSNLAAGVWALAGGNASAGATDASGATFVPTGLTDLPGNVSHLADVLGSANLWKRAGMVAGGLALLAAGAVLMAETFSHAGIVSRAVRRAAPQPNGGNASAPEPETSTEET